MDGSGGVTIDQRSWCWNLARWVFLVCVLATGRHREALCADAHTTVGTVIDVRERPGSGDAGPICQLLVDAVIPGGVTIHRRINIGGDADPLRWVGKPVRFRHRTLDPDDLDGAFFGREECKATLGPGA